MNKKEIIEQFFGFTIATYFNWKKEQRPVINFFETYFEKLDIEEYLKENTITKLDSLSNKISLDANDIFSIHSIILKIDNFSREKALREGILILFYRVVRDMPSKNYSKSINDIVESEEYLNFIKNYSLLTKESMKNLLTPNIKKHVENFFSDYLSKNEINILLEKKIYILPPLKSMRKHNSHLKD